jgi:hypothetical protein
MKKWLVNPENPNGVLVNLTEQEVSEFNTSKEKASALMTQMRADKQARKDAQVSGNQKLLDLGLTQAEATALTGYTPPVEE